MLSNKFCNFFFFFFFFAFRSRVGCANSKSIFEHIVVQKKKVTFKKKVPPFDKPIWQDASLPCGRLGPGLDSWPDLQL